MEWYNDYQVGGAERVRTVEGRHRTERRLVMIFVSPTGRLAGRANGGLVAANAGWRAVKRPPVS